jgi:WD40 repeat protein
LENNAELMSIIENTSAINILDWNPDGNLLVAGDADGLIKVWNIDTKTLVDSLEWHHYMVHTLDWSPDGNYISSAARDHSLHIWDVSGIDTE